MLTKMTSLLKRVTPIGAVNNTTFYEVPATTNRLDTAYQLLKVGPALSLASEIYERPEIRTIAILGYN
jgi:hypothetical protein